MKSYTHEVIRPISGAPYQAGDLVDASGWKNARPLERLRYIRRIKGTPIGADQPEAPQPSTPDGLRTDGPTLEEYVEAGYLAENYPPQGWAEKPSPGLDAYRASQLESKEPDGQQEGGPGPVEQTGEQQPSEQLPGEQREVAAPAVTEEAPEAEPQATQALVAQPVKPKKRR